MTTEPSEGFAPLVYLAVIGRWKWLVVGVTLLATIAGAAYLKTRTPMYQATAGLLHAQPVTINMSNPFVQGGVPQAFQKPDIGAVSAVVTSSQVGSAAAQLLSGEDTSAGYYVSVAVPMENAGNPPADAAANVVAVTAVSSNPRTAADAANAYAQAFVGFRRDSAHAQVSDALAVVRAALESHASPTFKESAEYLQLKQSQQALELQLQSLSSDFTVVAPATVPSVPFSPRPRHTLALAIILGLALGFGLAVLFELLDTRVRDERQMTDLLGLSALTHLPPLARRTPEGASVQMLSNSSGPMAEAIRVLRGNLSFTGVDGDVRSVLVTSSVRSEGKSVTACNLAVAMALAGQRVVLVDADLRRPRIHTYMRVSNVVGLSSVLARRAELLDAVVPIPLEGQGSGEGESAVPEPLVREGASGRIVSMASSGRVSEPALRYTPRQSSGGSDQVDEPMLRVLPSGPLPPNPGEMAASQRFGEIIALLADSADMVIIDSPPLLEVGDAAAMAARADGVVFVANMARVRWPMLERAQAQLEKFPCRKLGLVVVATKSAHQPAYGYEYRASPRGAAPPAGRS